MTNHHNQSYWHFARECPHPSETHHNDKLHDVFFTMNEYEDVFVNEEVNHLLMDTGCPRTVAGCKWLKTQFKNMDPEIRALVRKYPSSTSFRFGGDDVKKSLGFYTIPIRIAGKNVVLQTDVIDANIPCLVSKAAMKKAGGLIDLQADSIRLFGKVIPMDTTASGHYTLPVEKYERKEGEENRVFVINHERPEYDEMQVHKMHKALGHPGRAAFEATIKKANVKIENLSMILDKLYETCSVCLKFSKSHVRPKVGLPIANDFNQTLCLDLKIWPARDAIIFYIIDAYTRFQQAHLIPDKKADTILECLMNSWIFKLYGAPDSILVDNGGEFYNNKLKDFCNNMNIKLYASSAESPWQNGLCERNHALTDRIMEKMFEEKPDRDINNVLSAATFAKNCMVNVNGYSPIQLVTGKMPRLPGVMTNNLPAQEAVSTYKPTSDRINEIFSSRKIFAEAENAKRLNQALLTKINPPIEHYEIGDRVYFKKHDSDTPFQGPASVIGVNGKTIFLAMGRFTYTTSRSRLVKIPRSPTEQVREVRNQDPIPPVTNPAQRQVVSPATHPDPDSDTDDEEEVKDDRVQPRVNEPDQAQAALPDPEQIPPAPPGIAPLPAPPVPNIREERDQSGADQDQTPSNQEEGQEDMAPAQNTKPHPKKKGMKLPYPKKGQEVFFRIKSTTSYSKVHPALVTKYGAGWANVTVLNKVYANSQKSGPYFNFRDVEDGFEGGVHLDQTQWTFSNSKPLPRTLVDSIHNYLVEDDPQIRDAHVVQVNRDKWHLPEVQEAMKKELDNFLQFEVYDLVPDRGQHFITSGWVVIEKEKEGQWITKARLVIHGNQEKESVRSDSPTVKKQNLRIQLALAVQNNWTMCSADVQAAFLQAVNLDREIYVKPHTRQEAQ